MEWDESVAEGEEEAGFAGPLGRYSGGTLCLNLADACYELRYEDDLVALFTRPGQYMVAETSAGGWELRHPRRSIFKIDAVDMDSGTVSGRYKRRLFTGRRSIRTHSPRPYPVRREAYELLVSQPTGAELLTIDPGRQSGELAVHITQEPEVPSDLDVLVVLCGYVALLGETWLDANPGGGLY